MGRTPFSSADGLRKGSWTAKEDQKLIAYIKKHGQGSWSSLPEKAGLQRCGKSCRLRWANYLRPGIKRGDFTSEEDQTIIKLHAELGNRWAAITKHLLKRTDNEIKNYWHAHLKKRLADMGIDPVTHKPSGTTPVASCSANSNTSTIVNTDPMIIHESTAQESEPIPQQPTSSRSTSASALLLNKLASRVTKLQSTVDPLRACRILQPNRTTGDDGANSGNTTAINCHSTPSCQRNNTPQAPDVSEYWLDNIGDPLSKPLNCSDMSNTVISPDSAEYGNASDDGGVSLDTNIDYPPSDALSTLENTGAAVVSAGGINVDVGSPVLLYNSNYLEHELEPSDLFDIPLNIFESTENFGPYA